MTEFYSPGAPGVYLVNEVQFGVGSVMRMEGSGDVQSVTWLTILARGTDRPDNTVEHTYAFDDNTLARVVAVLTAEAQHRGLL